MRMVEHISDIVWGLVATGLTALIGVFIRLLIQYGKQMKSLKEGMLWLQHDRLLQACKFYLKQKKMDVDDYENLEGLYKSYKGLGGNGTITRLFERVSKLDIKDDDDEE